MGFVDELDVLDSTLSTLNEGEGKLVFYQHRAENYTGDKRRYYTSKALQQALPFEIFAAGSSASFKGTLSDFELFQHMLRGSKATTIDLSKFDSANGTFAVVISTPNEPINISVVVPTFNPDMEKFRRCLDALYEASKPLTSVGGQVEIIVVDDGSTAVERTRVEIATRQSSLPAGVALRSTELNENSGVAVARTTGFEQARFDFVVFMDYDDFVSRAHLALVGMELSKGADVVASDMIFPDGHVFCAINPASAQDVFNSNCFGSGIGVNRSRPIFSDIRRSSTLYNSANKHHYEDWEFNCLISMLRAKIVVVPYPTYFYDLSSNGRDSQFTDQRFSSFFTTPMNAIERFAKIRPSEAYTYQRFYAEFLLSKLIESDLGSLSLFEAVRLLTKRRIQKLDSHLGHKSRYAWLYRMARPLLFNTFVVLRKLGPSLTKRRQNADK